jgi:hypothetical protein
MYTEYFQWSPEDNSNSKSHTVKSGQTLHGSLDYDASSDSYTLSQVRWKNRAKRKRERGQRDLCRAGLSMSALSMRRDGPFAPSFGHRASLPVALLRSPNVPSLAPFRPASAPLPPCFRPASTPLPLPPHSLRSTLLVDHRRDRRHLHPGGQVPVGQEVHHPVRRVREDVPVRRLPAG